VTGAQADFYVRQAFPVSYLGEGHGEKLIQQEKLWTLWLPS